MVGHLSISNSNSKSNTFFFLLTHSLTHSLIRGVVAGLLYAVENAAYVIAIVNTYTVNVYSIFAISAVFITILSYFVNNESFNFRLLFTTIVCFAGTHSLTHSLTYLLA